MEKLWIGTTGGLHLFDPQTQRFELFVNPSDEENSTEYDPSFNLVRPDNANNFFEAPDGSFWIPYHMRGVSRFNPNNGKFTPFRHIPSNPNSLSSDYVNSLFNGSRGKYSG